MNGKRVLRFYFSAECLNGALDNLILKEALRSESDLGEACAQRILKLIEAKCGLSLLWGYLNGVMQGFSAEDVAVLKGYAHLRCGIGRLAENERRITRRVSVRFFRRAKRLESFKEGLRLVNVYYALLRG